MDKKQHKDIEQYGHKNERVDMLSVKRHVEKIVTALYMVTGVILSDKHLRERLRFLGIQLISHTYSLDSRSKEQVVIDIGHAEYDIAEINALLEVSVTLGFITDMNFNILHTELNKLVRQIESVSHTAQFTRLWFDDGAGDRKSTRLNSSHTDISRMPSSA